MIKTSKRTSGIEASEAGLVRSLDRALGILDALATAPAGLRLVDLSRHVDIAKSTAHRLIATLERRGFVVRHPEDGRYVLGPQRTRLRGALAEPALQAGQSVTLGVSQRCRTGRSSAMSTTGVTGKVTVPHLRAMASRGEIITMVTAYDYPSARLADDAGIEIVLVGDSLAMTVLGHPNTLSVTMDEMIIFTRAVSRACTRALVIGDLPYGSYTIGEDDAVRNALRFIKEAGADAVKLEGGVGVAPIVRRLVGAGIPVMGHIGLTPQSLAVLGGFRVQGRSAAGARQLLQDCRALEQAGAFAVVVEAVPAVVGAAITEALDVPTLGIGAGPHCAGQVLIWHDLFGLYHGHTPKFARRYGEAGRVIAEGLAAFAADVRAGRFPTEEHTYGVPEAERAAIERVLAEFRQKGTAASSEVSPAFTIPTSTADSEGQQP